MTQFPEIHTWSFIPPRHGHCRTSTTTTAAAAAIVFKSFRIIQLPTFPSNVCSIIPTISFVWRISLHQYSYRILPPALRHQNKSSPWSRPPCRTVKRCTDQRYFTRTRLREFELHLRWNVLLLPYLNTWYMVHSIRNIFRGVLAWHLTPTTRTRTRTRTLWGDLCLYAVACEGSRLIRPKGDALDGGCAFQNSRTRVCI